MFPSFRKCATSTLWVIGCSLAVAQSAVTDPMVLEWESMPYGRRAPLNDPGQGGAGFQEMEPGATGLIFTNLLTQVMSDLNNNLANGSGIALGDINDDDLCDVFLASVEGQSQLFLNQGHWRFREATLESGLSLPDRPATGALLEDLDGDQDLDLVVAFNGAGVTCWYNNGEGQFQDRTPAGFQSRTGPTSLAISDLDQNGLLDLYVANYGENTLRSGAAVRLRTVRGKQVVMGRWRDRIDVIDGQMVEFGEPDQLWLQTQPGVFQLQSWIQGAFLDPLGKPLTEAPRDLSLSVMIRDLNQDGLPDIYECNDFHCPDRFWINQGDGVFQAIGLDALRTMCHFSMGVDAADVNRDGYLDLYAVDMLSPLHAIRMIQQTQMNPDPRHLPLNEPYRRQVRRNTLLMQREDGSYRELARLAGLEATDWSWCPIFLDVDLDGWDDLLVVNGHLMDALDSDVMERRQKLPEGSSQRAEIRYPPLITPNLAFRNLGNLSFEPAGVQWGFQSERVCHGFALGDLDLDGDLDLVINCLNDQVLLYQNKVSAPRFSVRLIGRGGNASAIGAKVALVGQKGRYEQEIIGGGRYLSDDQNLKTFAMNMEPSTSHVEITWPDGTLSIIEAIQAGMCYEIDANKLASRSSKPIPPPAVNPLFRQSDASIQLPARPPSRPDWEWQPSLNRPLLTERAPVQLVPKQQTGVDRLRLIDTASESGKVQHPIRAWAWVDSQRQSHLKLLEGMVLADPQMPTSPIQGPAPFATADVNQDGHEDVFVGLPPLPGLYPLDQGSRLYLGGNAAQVESGAPWSDLGRVRAAVFTDFNQDRWPDLVVACEWSALRLFQNKEGSFTEVTEKTHLSQHLGWWQSLVTLDVDQDGDEDLVAGNWGRNTRYQTYMKHGLRLYQADVNQDGVVEMMEARFDASARRWLPLDGLAIQEKVFAGLRNLYPSHRAFAEASMETLSSQLGLGDAFLHINTLDSMLFINQGGHFEAVALPDLAQHTPIPHLVTADFNQDGDPDLFIAQNWESTPEHVGAINAGQGLVLLGGVGSTFEPLSSTASGIRIDAEQQGVWVGDANGDQRPDLWIQHSGTIELYLNQHGL